MGVIYVRQIKAARALLGWTQDDLAKHSDVSKPTIARLEKDDGVLAGYQMTRNAIRRALEEAGVEFIDQNGGGFGVRLRSLGI